MKFLILLFVIQSADASCRDPKQKHAFDKLNGYPHGRPGYVVDHVCALECGGIDSPKNMQYQTYADGKTKDRWERTQTGCMTLCNPENSTATRQVFNCRGKHGPN